MMTEPGNASPVQEDSDFVYTSERINSVSQGTLELQLLSAVGFLPISNASVTFALTGSPQEPFAAKTTDSSGQTAPITIPTPDITLSLTPDQAMPYSEITVTIKAPDYETIQISGLQIFPDRLSRLTVRMKPLFATDETGGEENLSIPAHTLYGSYPEKLPEAEIKPLPDTGEIVLSQVVIPEFIIVHDGDPQDSSARNYYVRYKDYIKNVAACEIYSTWPEAAIYANLLAIMSFTLNRVYTEWYRSKGYAFTITSSTAYDQKWVNGRNTYANIDLLVDSIFANYLSRPGVRQPIFTSYCANTNTGCRGMSQWGSRYLADEGYSAIEILRYYYGNDIYINTAQQISGVPSSYPGYELLNGSTGDKVRQLQSQLNRIARNFPAIETLVVDGIYGPRTTAAVKTFQLIFGLPATGTTNYATWYKISDIYTSVTRLSEPVVS